MKILVLGAAGKIGSALLKDLIRSEGVSEIVAADLKIQGLEKLVRDLGNEKVQTAQVNAANKAQLVELMRDGIDVVASAVLSSYQNTATRAAITAGVHFCDVGQPYEVFKLNEEATTADVTVVPSCGLDPGIDRVCRGYAIGRLDKVFGLYLWCGGIPPPEQKDDNPINYKISWAWFRAVSTYLGEAEIIRDGKVVKVPKLENPQTIIFPEPIGECEAFMSRAPFDLIEQLNLTDIREAYDTSIRWKGHCEIWKKLIGLHLTDFEPLPVNMRIQLAPPGSPHKFDTEYLEPPIEISPFEFLSALGEKYLHYDLEKGEGDLVLLRSKVTGEKNGEPMMISHELIENYDPETGVTAMGRTTAYPCSIVAQMIAKGDITERGVVHCGKIGRNPKTAEIYFQELAKRNINLTETVSRAL
ncbi:MAG: saccharopine dehydrogenase C-terminal domain-containing protein [Candidatus Heimdallarchaeota archaeon]